MITTTLKPHNRRRRIGKRLPEPVPEFEPYRTRRKKKTPPGSNTPPTVPFYRLLQEAEESMREVIDAGKRMDSAFRLLTQAVDYWESDLNQRD